MAYAWKGTFLKLKQENQEIVEKLKTFIISQGFQNSEIQIEAWRDQIDFLIKYTPDSYDNTSMVFEYVIEEGYIRPDVLIFLNSKIIILEFKMKGELKARDALQLNNYRETLNNFHEYTWRNKIYLTPFLVLTKDRDQHKPIMELNILNEENFNKVLNDEFTGPMDSGIIESWITSSFDATPTLFEASVRLFKEKKLPRIKSVEEGELRPAYNRIQELIHSNKKEKNIIFICGVPGAGKTLLALQTMYKELERGNKKIAFVSGNTPLLSVLKRYLKEETGVYPRYIEGIYKYLREAFENPPDNIKNLIIYDEAQRAWDNNRMIVSLMNKGQDLSTATYNALCENSEAGALLKVSNIFYEMQGKMNLLIVLGPGQEIYLGEELGIDLWIEELGKEEFKDWNIYLPEKYKKHFNRHTEAYPEFFLSSNIRSNTAKLSGFAKGTLSIRYKNYNDRVSYLSNYIKDMYKKGYFIAFSKDMDKCKSLVQDLSKKEDTYGIIGPSHARYRKMVTEWKKHGKYDKWLEDFDLYKENIEGVGQVNHKNASEWFLRDSNKLDSIATEFHCQGLELDYSIVCMYGDYAISEYRRWRVKDDILEAKNDKKLDYDRKFRDFEKIVRNRWIVLLTRARKGMILHIPDKKEMKHTRQFFKDIGVIEV